MLQIIPSNNDNNWRIKNKFHYRMWCYVSVFVAVYRSIIFLGNLNATHFSCVIHLCLGFQILSSNELLQ